METNLIKRITKTLWKQGSEPQRLFIFIYTNEPSRYRWETPYYITDGFCSSSEDFNYYNQYVRTLYSSKYKGGDDIYILEIEHYNVRTGMVNGYQRSGL